MKQGEHDHMKSKKGYWQRQAYMLSSIGLFYMIILAFFAIPLLGTFVVILIQGAIDFRYLILAVGCIGLIGVIVLMTTVARRFWRKMQGEGFAVSEDVRRHMVRGKPVEISFLNGLLTFKSGESKRPYQRVLSAGDPVLLPHDTGQDTVGDVLDQLRNLSELKQSGAIDTDEYNRLKTMIIESSTTSDAVKKGDPY